MSAKEIVEELLEREYEICKEINACYKKIKEVNKEIYQISNKFSILKYREDLVYVYMSRNILGNYVVTCQRVIMHLICNQYGNCKVSSSKDMSLNFSICHT